MDISAIAYSPLNEENEEIRLITFVHGSGDTNLIHCNLETVSLKSYNAEYQSHISASSSTASKRHVLTNWVHKRYPSRPLGKEDQNVMDNHIPAAADYRFLWGDYAALSYVWGDENATSRIVVNGQEIWVTRNLEVALRALNGRSDFEGGYKLWVDALCINQADLKERGRQVGRMQDLYGNAWAVIAWLGEEDDESDKGINLLQALATASRENRGQELEARLIEQPNYLGSGSWLALHELMQRPYWTRLWILQEIVLGSSGVVVRCGNSFINWRSVCDGLQLLMDHLWVVKDWLRVSDLSLSDKSADPIWNTTSIHLIYQDLTALSQHEEHGEDRLSFGRLLDMACAACSRDIRDKVYGLLGIMDPIIAKQLAPDYTIDPPKIFTAVAKAFILAYNNLEPLRETNPWGKTYTPSWAADWSWNGRLRYARPESPLWGPFWSQDAVNALPYSASGKTLPQCSFSNGDCYLTCRGFLIDKIAGLGARGSSYFSWLEGSIVQPECGKSIYGNRASTAKALCHALVADRVSNGQTAGDRHEAILSLPSTFQSAEPQFTKLGWKWLAGQGGYDFHSRGWRLASDKLGLEGRRLGYYFRWEDWRLANKEFRLGDQRLGDYFTDRIPNGASEYDYTEVYNCFDRTCKNRRFMTTSNGYLGWAPDNIYGSDDDQTRKGDMICIIFGCSTPIIIRPHSNLFKVVGEAYVQGLMDGEGMQFLEAGQYQVEEFTFC